jgi:putative oxidoreductase
MSFSETISPFFGRCFLVWFYLSNAMDILTNWHHIAGDMAAKHVILPPLVLLVVLIFIFLGSVSLLFGYHARHGAVLLFALTMITAFTMHDFWHYSDAGARALEFGIFARDFAICGGLLLMIGMGPGAFALDNRSKGGGGGGGKRR